MSKIFDRKSFCKNIHKLVECSITVPCEYQIINIYKYKCEMTIILIDKDLCIIVRICEANLEKECFELSVPKPRGLFKAIDVFFEFADIERVDFVNETRGL